MMTLAPIVLLALTAAPRPPGVEDEVKSADIALARAVAAHDTAAFAALLEPEAIFASAGGVSRGRDAVIVAWRAFLTEGGPSLMWRPTSALVAASGDVAVTTGRFTWSGVRDGKPSQSEGEYVTVWRRGPDRRWRVALDASLVPAKALGAGLVRKPLQKVRSAAGDLEGTLGTWNRGEDRGVYLTVRRGRALGETPVDSAFLLRHSR